MPLARRPSRQSPYSGSARPLTPDPKLIEKYATENKKDLDQQDADHQQHLASLASGSVVAASGDCSGSDGEGFINLSQLAAHRDAQRILEEASRSLPSRWQLAHESLLRRAKRCDALMQTWNYSGPRVRFDANLLDL